MSCGLPTVARLHNEVVAYEPRNIEPSTMLMSSGQNESQLFFGPSSNAKGKGHAFIDFVELGARHLKAVSDVRIRDRLPPEIPQITEDVCGFSTQLPRYGFRQRWVSVGPLADIRKACNLGIGSYSLGSTANSIEDRFDSRDFRCGRDLFECFRTYFASP